MLRILLSIEEFVDNRDEARRVLFARIMAQARHCDDCSLRQGLLQLFLGRGWNDRAAAADDINDRRFNFAHKTPEFGWNEPVADRRIAFPDHPAILPELRSV